MKCQYCNMELSFADDKCPNCGKIRIRAEWEQVVDRTVQRIRDYAKSDIEFTPEGIQNTYEWMSANLDLLKSYSEVYNQILNELSRVHDNRKIIDNSSWAIGIIDKLFILLEKTKGLEMWGVLSKQIPPKGTYNIQVINNRIYEQTRVLMKKLIEILYLRNVSMIDEVQRITPQISNDIRQTFEGYENINNRIKQFMDNVNIG